MKTFNVKQSVVAFVQADSEGEAVAKLHGALTAAGFEVYDGDPGPDDAFEVEPLGYDLLPLPGGADFHNAALRFSAYSGPLP